MLIRKARIWRSQIEPPSNSKSATCVKSSQYRFEYENIQSGAAVAPLSRPKASFHIASLVSRPRKKILSRSHEGAFSPSLGAISRPFDLGDASGTRELSWPRGSDHLAASCLKKSKSALDAGRSSAQVRDKSAGLPAWSARREPKRAEESRRACAALYSPNTNSMV